MVAEIFKKPKPILGKVQLPPLPGAPGWQGAWTSLALRAEQEATALATGGVDGLIIENFHDAPYAPGRMDVAGAVAMALLARRLKQFTELPIGISVLRNDPETALAIALNVGADFLRLSLLTGSLMSEEGVINSRLHALSSYQRQLQGKIPPLLVDVSTRHLALQHQPTRTHLQHLIEVAHGLPKDAGCAAIVVSDEEVGASELPELQAASPWPVIVENRGCPHALIALYDHADGVILEADTRKQNALQPGLPPTIDMARVEERVNRLRKVVPVSEMDPSVFLQR